MCDAISISIIKDVVLITTGVIGSIIGFKGYSLWKKQLSGIDKYNIGKKALLALIDFEDGIKTLRNSLSPSVTIPNPDDSINTRTNKEYQKRIEIAYDKRKNLLLAFKECDVVTNFEYSKKIVPLNLIFVDVIISIQIHLSSLLKDSSDNNMATFKGSTGLSVIELLYDVGAEDKLNLKIRNHILEIEKDVRKLFK